MRTTPTTTRRWAALLAAGALLAAACGSSGDGGGGGGASDGGERPPLPPCPVEAVRNASGPVELLLWFQLNAKAAETMRALVDRFNGSQTKIRVRAEIQGADYEELLAAYQRNIPTNRLPDIAVMEQTTLQYLVDTNTVLPGQSCFEADRISLDPFDRNSVNYYSVGGVFYPASASNSDILTYYNKDHYRRAGLDPDKAPATLEDVRRDAERIKAAGITDRPVIMKMASWALETQLTGVKEAVVDNDNGHGSGETTKATFNTPNAQRFVTWIRDMIRDGLLTAIGDTPGQFDQYLALANQRATMTVETSVAATSVKAFLGGDTGVAGTIGADGKPTGGLEPGVGMLFGLDRAGPAQVGGNAIFITKPADPASLPEADRTASELRQSAAWEFMTWWNEPAQQLTWLLEGSYLPFRSDVVDDPQAQAFFQNDAAGKMLKVADEERRGIDPAHTGPVIGPYREFRGVIRNALDKVAFSGAEPAAALDEATREVDELLKRYNETNFN